LRIVFTLKKTHLYHHHPQFEEFSSKGFWEVEVVNDENPTYGGLVKWNGQIRLRHLSSGRYLAVQEPDSGRSLSK
jgi:hypothetical protein